MLGSTLPQIPCECNTLRSVPTCQQPKRFHCRGTRRLSLRAEKEGADGPSTSDAEREQRLATLEKRGRKRDLMPQPTRQAQQTQKEKAGPAEWKEGKLLPEGWDKMDPPQKVYELYTGKRGLLFWANKLSYASLFVIGGAWVLFRFVGPALGLYKLANDISSPGPLDG